MLPFNFFGGNMFPYTNLDNMNMDWIIGVVKNFLNQYTNIQELIQNTTNEGIAELETKKNQLEALLNQWYNTHSNDIANQLASAIADLNAYVANVTASIPADYSTLSRMASDTKDTTLVNGKRFNKRSFKIIKILNI